MPDHARILETELNAAFEAVVSFTDACRFVSDEALRTPALQLASEAEALLAAAIESLSLEPAAKAQVTR